MEHRGLLRRDDLALPVRECSPRLHVVFAGYRDLRRQRGRCTPCFDFLNISSIVFMHVDGLRVIWSSIGMAVKCLEYLVFLGCVN